MVELIKMQYGLRRVTDTFPTAEEALATLDTFFAEEDADYPGCWDVMTKAGDIFVIEPVGFTIQ